MEKHDSAKPPIHLVPNPLITEVAKVLAFGARKYSPHQWREGTDWSRIYSATMRHLLAWNSGETNDPESGLNHLAHAASNIAFLLEYSESNTGTDDRYKYITSLAMPDLDMSDLKGG